MKKTIQIHILGIQFTLEEEAYDILKSYLDRLHAVLENNPDHQEIYKDVEARIAELATLKTNELKQVLELSDIEEIIATLGNPEEFMDENNESSSSEQKSNDKKMYRDTQKASIAGVCAGLASYFNLDVMLIRILFVVFFFIGIGFVIPVYIILWIIVPPARTNAERLQMSGRPVTLETLKEEFAQAGKNVKNNVKNGVEQMNEGGAKIKSGLSFAFLILMKIVGIFFLIFAFSNLIGTFAFLALDFKMGSAVNGNSVFSISQISDLFTIDSNNSFYLKTGIISIQICISLFFMIVGTAMVFKLRSKWMRPSILFLLFVGILSSVLITVQVIYLGLDFSRTGIVETERATLKNSTLIIEALPSSIIPSNSRFRKNHNNFFQIKNKEVYDTGIDFEYGVSEDSLFHIYTQNTARGKSEFSATKRAKNIKNKMIIDDNKLTINPTYSYPLTDKFRNQEVKYIIFIPKNGQIQFQGNLIKAENYKDDGYLSRNGIYQHDKYEN